jgi:hypothetical protein
MGRAKRLGAETAAGGLAIEYVRTRKVVRLLGWLYGEAIPPVEIPVDELCDRLGIDPRELVAPHRFLLFAGSHRRPGGGRRDLVATFASEEKAWAAFAELRQSHPATRGWAELAVIDGSGQVNQLAWFGLHPAHLPPDDEVSSVATDRDRRRARRRILGAEGAPTYLRAVTPS